MGEGDTLLNALIGAVVGTVLAFVPFSTVLGGAVAGYLQRGSRRDGLRVGALAGVIALVPFVLVVVLGFGVFLAGAPVAVMAGGQMPGGPGPSVGFGLGAGAFVLLLVITLLFGLVYVVALYAIGGWLGNYLAVDADV